MKEVKEFFENAQEDLRQTGLFGLTIKQKVRRRVLEWTIKKRIVKLLCHYDPSSLGYILLFEGLTKEGKTERLEIDMERML